MTTLEHHHNTRLATLFQLFKFLMGLALDLEPELCGPMSRDLSNDTVLVSKHSELVDKMEYYDRSVRL